MGSGAVDIAIFNHLYPTRQAKETWLVVTSAESRGGGFRRATEAGDGGQVEAVLSPIIHY